MFENGESVVEVIVALGISKQTFYNWQHEHPEFLDAVNEGLVRSEAWWTKKGRDGLVIRHQGSRLDTGLWKCNMANRFNWREKADVTSGGEKIKMPNVVIEHVEAKDD